MSTNGRWIWLVGIAALALAFGGPMGCGGGDDDNDGDGPGTTTTTVVVTNTVNGTTVTNTVVVTNTQAVLNVAGVWTGNFQTDVGEGQLQLDLDQNGTAIIGQFRIGTGGADQVGNASGSISGDRLVVMLDVTANDRWMELDGHANASATRYIGNLTGFYGQGQFDLHK